MKLNDYVESSLDGTATAGDQLSEIANIEEAMAYVESTMQPGNAISEHFIRELHAIAVRKLVREGDATPGTYRTGQVQISQSEHLPPDGMLVERKMLHPIAPNARQYTLGFDSSYLIHGVIHALSQESFISAPLTGRGGTP